MGMLLRLSVEDFVRDYRRSFLSAVGLALVIASYFILTALSNAFSLYLNKSDLGRNLIIIQKDVYDPADAVLGQEAITAINDYVPGMLSRVSPFVFRHTNIDGKVLMLRSAELKDWETVYRLELRKGEWPQKFNEIAADEGFAEANHWHVGSNIQIFGTQFIITSVYRAPNTTFASIWMPISTFKNIFSLRGGYQALYAQVATGNDPEFIRTQLENDPRLNGRYAVYFENNYVQRNTQALQDMSSLNSISSFVALLGIVFGIYNAVSLSIVERGFEIGVLLGIGFSKQNIRSFILARTTWLILFSFLAGLSSALVYAKIQQAYSPIFIFGLPLNLKITLSMVIYGLGLVIIMSMLGTWLSTRRLFSLRIVEIMREQ